MSRRRIKGVNKTQPGRDCESLTRATSHEEASLMSNANAIEPRFVGSIWLNQRRGPRVAVYSAGPDPAVILDIESRACTIRLGLTAAEARRLASLVYAATIGTEDDLDEES